MYPKTPLFNQLKEQIQAKTDTDFQRFITNLFLELYGSTGFIPLREEKDKGCDGIVVADKCIIACYGPKKYDKKKFTDKIESDFKKYQANWESQYSNWRVVYNSEIAPDQIKIVTGLKNDSILVGIDQILALIESKLPHSNLRKLAASLGVDRDLISQDVLGQVLEDLLKDSLDDIPHPDYSRVVYIEEKVKLNFTQDEVSGVLAEYTELVQNFPQLTGLIAGYDDQEKSSLKVKILNDLGSLQGTLHQKLRSLTDKYLSKYSTEDDGFYLTGVRTILLYLFEQCLIGDKTPAEVKC